MANSTTNIDTIAQSQAGKEITANAFFDAASPATLYGRRASTCAALTWGYYGGAPTLSGGSLGSIANGTLSLTPSTTNYIVAAKATGAVTTLTSNTNWNDTTNYWRLYSVVAGSATVTSYTDNRELGKMTGGGGGAAITAKDEGSNLTTALASLNFAGAGVTATTSGNDVTVTIPGAGSAAVTVKDEGTTLTTSLTSMNFVGSGVTATNLSGDVTVSITTAGREVLSGNRTYYVRTDGSNSNDGLSNTSGGAFLTIQKAVDTAMALDVNGKTVTIQVADGTYTGATSVTGPIVGGGALLIQGNTTTPANALISVTSNNAFYFSRVAGVTLTGFKLATTTSGYGVVNSDWGSVVIGVLDFGACASGHIATTTWSVINCNNNYTISGSAPIHIFSISGARLICASKTITLSGTPAFSTAYISQASISTSYLVGNTYSGSATGKRYDITQNSICESGTTLPGSIAGTTTTGGQYS